MRPSSRISIAVLALAAAFACGCARRTLVLVDPDPCADGGVAGCVPPGLLDGLVGAWHLDDGTGTMARDWSGHGNDGTLLEFNTAPPWTVGRAAGGLAVEAIGYVNVAPSVSIDSITDQVTISGWIYFEGTVSDYATAASREIGDTVDQHYHISINMQEVPTLFIATDGGTARIVGEAAVTRQSWVHIAGTYDGSVVHIYVNGVQQSMLQALTGRFMADTTPFILGANGNGPATGISERFPGRIDEIMLYRRALSADEIAMLYNGAAFASPSPPDAGARD